MKWPALPDERVQFNAPGKRNPSSRQSRQDVAPHRLMALLKVIQNLQWQLRGSQICERRVGIGSKL